MSNNLRNDSALVCARAPGLSTCHRGGVHQLTFDTITATWTVQEHGSSSNLSGFLGFRARSLRWCIHLDAVLSPRAYCSRIVLMGDSFFRYYRDLCMHTYAIDEMTPHFFLLTVHRHPIGCLRQLVSTHILQGELHYTNRTRVCRVSDQLDLGPPESTAARRRHALRKS